MFPSATLTAIYSRGHYKIICYKLVLICLLWSTCTMFSSSHDGEIEWRITRPLCLDLNPGCSSYIRFLTPLLFLFFIFRAFWWNVGRLGWPDFFVYSTRTDAGTMIPRCVWQVCPWAFIANFSISAKRTNFKLYFWVSGIFTQVFVMCKLKMCLMNWWMEPTLFV